jgi:hypothetical protein
MDADLEKLLHESMDKKISDAKGFFNTTKRKVIGAVVVFVLVLGIVFASHWYTSDKTKAWLDEIGRKFDAANQSQQEEILRNKIKIEDLEKGLAAERIKVKALQEKRRIGIKDAIESKDSKRISGQFDNVVDSYAPPRGWGR